MLNSVQRPAIALFFSLTFGSVVGFSQTSDPSPGMTDGGSWYSREQWPHDGRPYESGNFIVYSDAASHDARRAVAELGEVLLAELVSDFGIDGDNPFRFPPGQEKIHIYAYKDRYPQAWGARAYYAGLIIWSLDHAKRPTDLDHYRATAKHELVHVVEALLKGRDVAEMPVSIRVHAWFSEGLAEAVTGGTSGGAVRDLAHLDYLTQKYGRLSPVSFTHDGLVGDWSEKETALASFEYHYPMYQLAVEYLIDEDGFGKSPHDVVGIFTDIADGSDFSSAFERRMGVSVAEYDARFFDLMRDYLPEGAPARFRWASLAWLVLTAVSAIVVAWRLAHDTRASRGRAAFWMLTTVIFGPFGLLGFLLAGPEPGEQSSTWRRALGESMYNVAGNALGLLCLFTVYSLFIPWGDPAKYALPVPLLVGWLVFRAPLAAARSHRSYLLAALRTLPAEIASAILVLTGMLGVLVPLAEKRWWFSLDPATPLFWLVFSIGALAGAVLVYPFNFWLVRRGSATWPAWATVESPTA